ncbi:MAG: TSUP family transporter [Dichotomicrobium sp.]
MPADILSTNLAIAAALLFGAGIVRGFTGFGAALLLAPVLAYLFGATSGVGIIILLNLIVSFQLIAPALRVSNFAGVGWLTAGACAAMPIGVWALGTFDPEAARDAISILVILACILIALPYQDHLHIRSSPAMDAFAGGLGGLMHGFAGIGGPPIIIYWIAQKQSAAALRANIILSFAIINIVTTLAFLVGGLLNTTMFLQTLLLTPPFLLGAWVGAHIFGRSSDRFFMRVVLVLLIVVAAGMLIAE